MSDKPREGQRHGGTKKTYPRINFRVDQELRRKIRMDADAQGLTIGSYMRWLADERARTRLVRRPLADERLLAQLKGQVGRIGGNIHQLVRMANRGEIPSPDELADACKEARDFLAAARDLLKGGQ